VKATDGETKSSKANITAALTPNATISPTGKDFLGIKIAIAAMAKPSTKYLITRLTTSVATSISILLKGFISQYFREMVEQEEHYLRGDEEIPGQKFCLLSFLSPEDVLERKDTFFFKNFVNQFEMTYKNKILEEFLAKTVQTINDNLETHAVEFEKQDLSGCADTCRNSKLRVDVILNDLNNHVKNNKNSLTCDNIEEKYQDYMYVNKVNLEHEFYKKNNFGTSIRGLKIRGVFGSQEEAEAYSRMLIKKDRVFHIYTAAVGQWVPWDPKPSEVKNQEYAEEELNTLMKKYEENIQDREKFYSEKRSKTRNIDNIVGPSEKKEDMFSDVGDLALQRKMDKK